MTWNGAEGASSNPTASSPMSSSPWANSARARPEAS